MRAFYVPGLPRYYHIVYPEGCPVLRDYVLDIRVLLLDDKDITVPRLCKAELVAG